MAGTLTLSTLSDGTNSTSATNPILGSAKAWVWYDGVAQTVIGSFNVSSVTYNATGQYTVNYTTAMPNANYCVVATAFVGNGRNCGLRSNQTTTSVQVGFFDPVAGSYNANTSQMNVAAFSS